MIEGKNIVKTYHTGDIETHALRGVSFTINDGEFVAIMGPSGSGKSTLMHILGCLDTPTSGTYFLDGEDASKLSGDALADIRKRKIGFVFQAFNLLPRTTVLRNVMLPLTYANVPTEEREKRARAALLAAGLDESRFQNKSNQLSGGQIQRVAIARALVNDPALILADEPTGNLDVETAWQITDLLEDISNFGTTVLVATHNLEIVRRMQRRVLTLVDGRLVRDQPAGRVGRLAWAAWS